MMRLRYPVAMEMPTGYVALTTALVMVAVFVSVHCRRKSPVCMYLIKRSSVLSALFLTHVGYQSYRMFCSFRVFTAYTCRYL